MSSRTRIAIRKWGLAGLALAVAVLAGLSAAPSRAAGPLDQIASSIHWVPDDAAFYSSSLRNGEQFEAIRKSRAWATLRALPAVQEGLTRLRSEIESGRAAPLKAFLENPEVRKGLQMLGDMFSHEVFIYADQGLADVLEFSQIVMATGRYGPLFAGLRGMSRDEADTQRARMMLAAAADNAELIRVPNLLVGFKITQRDLAVQQLAKLEGFVNLLFVFQPKLASQWKRTQVAGSEFLCLTLHGESIPWDDLPLDRIREHELEKGQIDKVVGKLRKLTLVIALGLHKDYLLLAIGPSTDLLARLGQMKPLSTRPEFKPLERFADRRLVGIDYVSEALLARLATAPRDIDDFADALKDLVGDSPLANDQKDQLRKDLGDLAGDLKGLIRKPGAMMSFQFLADHGLEGYTYDWGEHPDLVATQPLSLLHHVGGRPILAIVGRSRNDPAVYDLLVKWLKVGHRYFEQLAVPQMEPHEQQQYQKLMERFRPLLKRLDQATRMLIEATADGQLGIVVDAQLKSRQFHQELPRMDRPMPMVEPALILGVSNPAQLRQAMSEYRAVWNEGIEALRQVVPEPDEIPNLRIPEPQVVRTASGTLYNYPLPDEWGVAKEIVISFALADHVAAVAVTTQHAGRILTPTPLSAGGVLSDPQRPRGSAALFNWAGLVDAASPWVEYAVRQIAHEPPEPPEKPKAKRVRPPRPGAKKGQATASEKPKAASETPQTPKPDAPTLQATKPQAAAEARTAKPSARRSQNATVMDQVRTVLRVLKCIPTITRESYREDGALVTHWLVEIRDLD